MLRREWMCPDQLLPSMPLLLKVKSSGDYWKADAQALPHTHQNRIYLCTLTRFPKWLVQALKFEKHCSLIFWSWKGGCCTTYGDENKEHDFWEISLQSWKYLEITNSSSHDFVCVRLELLKWHFKTLLATFYFPLSPLLLENSFKSSISLKAGDYTPLGFKWKPYRFLQGA